MKQSKSLLKTQRKSLDEKLSVYLAAKFVAYEDMGWDKEIIFEM